MLVPPDSQIVGHAPVLCIRMLAITPVSWWCAVTKWVTCGWWSCHRFFGLYGIEPFSYGFPNRISTTICYKYATYGYGSIPMKIPFLGVIHIHFNPAILMWTKKGYYWFWHTILDRARNRWLASLRWDMDMYRSERLAGQEMFGSRAVKIYGWYEYNVYSDDIENVWLITCIQFNDGWYSYGDGSKPWYLVNPKIAGKWMFIPLKMYL